LLTATFFGPNLADDPLAQCQNGAWRPSEGHFVYTYDPDGAIYKGMGQVMPGTIPTYRPQAIREDNMKKRISLSVLFMLIGNLLFSFSPREQHFQVENHLNENIVVRWVYRENPDRSQWRWIQYVSGLAIGVTSRSGGGAPVEVLPNKWISIVSYFPDDLWSSKNQDQRRQEYNELPLFEILNVICQSLTVTTSDGTILLELEDLKNYVFRDVLSGVTIYHIIDIYTMGDAGRIAPK
jgi:hypothetical protein